MRMSLPLCCPGAAGAAPVPLTAVAPQGWAASPGPQAAFLGFPEDSLDWWESSYQSWLKIERKWCLNIYNFDIYSQMSFKSGTPSAQWKLYLKVRSSAEAGGGDMHSQKQALYSMTEVLGKSVHLGCRRHAYRHSTFKFSAAGLGQT